jgi:phage shock protein PspC (stress-responsive transcriptional regulator)
VDPWWIRLAWAVGVLAFGSGILLYLILWWLMPAEDAAPVEPTVWVKGASGEHRPPLHRTAEDRKLLGVCGGIARRWGWEPTLVRLGAFAAFGMSAGLAIFAYLAAALFMTAPAVARSEPHPVEL